MSGFAGSTAIFWPAVRKLSLEFIGTLANAVQVQWSPRSLLR